MIFTPKKVDKKSHKRRQKQILLYLFAGVVLILIFFSYHYGTEIYYRWTGDPIGRLQKQFERVETKLPPNQGDVVSIYEILRNNRKILKFLAKDRPLSAEVYYLLGLDSFYELMIRIPPTSKSLVQLCSREILPIPIEHDGMPNASITSIAFNITKNLRRSFSLDPSYKKRNRAIFALMYGDFFYTARTDPLLFRSLEQINSDEMTDAFIPHYQWMAIGLYTIGGKEEDFLKFINTISSNKEKGRRQLEISQGELMLLQAITSFKAKNYLVSLRIVRQMKEIENISEELIVEALRLEGEIFYIQRGAESALPFFREALKLAGGEDFLIQQRIEELENIKI